jgi:hypothetical protein
MKNGILHHVNNLPIDALIKGDPVLRHGLNDGVGLGVELSEHPPVHVVREPLVFVSKVRFVVGGAIIVGHHRPRGHNVFKGSCVGMKKNRRHSRRAPCSPHSTPTDTETD